MAKDPEKLKAKSRRYYERNKARLCEKERLKYWADIEKEREVSRLKAAELRSRPGAVEARKEQRQKEWAAKRIAGGRCKGAEKAWLLVRRETERKAVIERKKVRKSRSADVFIGRLRKELPELYDPGLCVNTLVFRARYHLDLAFKAKQIERTSKRDSRYPLMDDGSLTPDVMRSMFSRKECPYCGEQMGSTDKTLDHIIPRWRGGWHSAKNTIVCCYSCNSKKGAKTPSKWLECIDESRRNHVQKAWQGAGAGDATQGWLIASNG